MPLVPISLAVGGCIRPKRSSFDDIRAQNGCKIVLRLDPLFLKIIHDLALKLELKNPTKIRKKK